MSRLRCRRALGLGWALSLLFAACQQSDQAYPFGPDGSYTLGPNGGIVTVPPGLSIRFPSGSLVANTSITASERTTEFPDDAGPVVPGTAYDVGPAGLSLAVPAQAQISVPKGILSADEELRLAIALERSGGAVTTSVTSYDVSNGILLADIDELGPLAAVIATDVSPVGDTADVPTLTGGAVPVSAGATTYTASCDPDARSCFSSGIIRLWVDDVVRSRLGDDILLVNTSVDASVQFYSFNPTLPDSAVGRIRIDGELRARLGGVVASLDVGSDVGFTTGDDDITVAEPTSVTVDNANAVIVFDFTSENDPEIVPYQIDGIGTSDQLTIQVQGQIDFANADGSVTYGTMLAHIRLRR